MTKLSSQAGATAAKEEAVLYPDNQLRPQQRAFGDALSAFKVVKAVLTH